MGSTVTVLNGGLERAPHDELSRLREALAKSRRLSTVGELSAGIAHDLRNTVGSVVLRLALLKRDAGWSAEQVANIAVIEAVLRDALDALTRLQDVARGRSPGGAGACELQGVIRDAAMLARAGLREEKLEIDVEAPALPKVAGSSAELRHVFLNLFLNARDAMPRGGTVRVRARVHEGRVIVTVADDGPGVPAKARARIFEPFFSTKGARGLGLGLAMAHDVLEGLGGSIALQPARKGATFRIELPVAGGAPRPRRARVAARKPRRARKS